MHALRHVYNLDMDIHSLFSGNSEHHLEKKKHLHMAFRLFPAPEVSVFVTVLSLALIILLPIMCMQPMGDMVLN